MTGEKADPRTGIERNKKHEKKDEECTQRETETLIEHMERTAKSAGGVQKNKHETRTGTSQPRDSPEFLFKRKGWQAAAERKEATFSLRAVPKKSRDPGSKGGHSRARHTHFLCA